jgi:hypothetical protein
MPGRREVAILDRARLERELCELPLSPRAARVPAAEDVSAGPVGVRRGCKLPVRIFVGLRIYSIFFPSGFLSCRISTLSI